MKIPGYTALIHLFILLQGYSQHNFPLTLNITQFHEGRECWKPPRHILNPVGSSSNIVRKYLTFQGDDTQIQCRFDTQDLEDCVFVR